MGDFPLKKHKKRIGLKRWTFPNTQLRHTCFLNFSGGANNHFSYEPLP